MRDTEQRLPKATRVKNKAPTDKQITAEQILREAKEIQLEEDHLKPPKTFITDPEELAEYRLRKRKEYEDLVRRVGRFNLGVWVKASAKKPHAHFHAGGYSAVHGAGTRLHSLPAPASMRTHMQTASTRRCAAVCDMGGAAEGLPAGAVCVGARAGC